METLAGNDDDDDNSSSGDEGGEREEGWWLPGRIRLASTHSCRRRVRNAIDMRKPRIPMARSFAQSGAFSYYC